MIWIQGKTPDSYLLDQGNPMPIPPPPESSQSGSLILTQGG
jgi:hypothetical protein